MSVELAVALVTGLFSVAGLAVSGLIHRNVGPKNGAGPVTKMLELTLDNQGRLEEKLDRHVTDSNIHNARR